MEIAAEKLRRVCDPESLGFETTEDANVNAKEGIIGQKKAFEALRVGVGVGGKDFNIFVAGSPDTGKTRLTKRFLEKIARRGKDFFDWCYVNNFEEISRPKALKLEAGKGKQFKENNAELLRVLRKEIPAFFSSVEWSSKMKEVLTALEERRNETIAALNEKARPLGCIVKVRDDGRTGLFIADPDNPEEAVKKATFDDLEEDEKVRLTKKYESAYNVLKDDLQTAGEEMTQVSKTAEQAVADMKQKVAAAIVSSIAKPLQEEHAGNPDVIAYFDSLARDVGKNLDKFSGNESENNPMAAMGLSIIKSDPEEFFHRYDVNVFVDNSGLESAPVVVETNPTYSNLFGAIESEMKMGVLTTNFCNIKAGALHRANGGYLIIPALNLLKQPGFCWESLKRAVKDQEIQIESMASHYFGSELKSLKPDAIPFYGKIIFIGESWLYHALYEYDDQFRNIFKVKVELEERTERLSGVVMDFIGVMAAFCKRNKLRPFDKTAAARLMDYLSEIAGSQKKFSLRLGEVENVLKEADFWTGERKGKMITRRDVNKAVRQREQRANLAEIRFLEFVREGIRKIDVGGAEIGQINGLVVFHMGDHTFGMPWRITARVGMGKEEIVNIERECDLAGETQTKSVYIVSGYLLGRYAQKYPLSLVISLCFEQSYNGVDGDSASAAELFAILSAISEVPIKQDFAITGSMNQNGKIQVIGGVNHKIKGFFKVCCDRGLTGTQGVIIPKDNLDDLMLPVEIVKAVQKGKFHIHAIETAEEGMELLTGLSMSEIDAKINLRLKEMDDIINEKKKK